MLNDIYQAIKGQLKTPSNSITGEPREGIDLNCEWFNMQYDGTMVHDSGFFVAFPDRIPFDRISKQARRTSVLIRLHHYSKAMQTHDGLSDATVEEHEDVALKAKALLDGFTPANGACKRLEFVGWQHWHKWKGWMVTFIEFEAKKEI